MPARAGESQEGLVDVALAVALAAGEHSLTTDRYDYSTGTVSAHVAFLLETGFHDFADVEAEAVRSRLRYDMRQRSPRSRTRPRARTACQLK